MSTMTRKFEIGDPVLVDLPSYCLKCGREELGAYGNVVEYAIDGAYIVTLESAREAACYAAPGKPVHVCGLRLACVEDELQPVTWHRNVHDACPACGGARCKVYATEDQANAALDHETLEREFDRNPLGHADNCDCDRLYRCPGCGAYRHRVHDAEHGRIWLCLNPTCNYDK